MIPGILILLSLISGTPASGAGHWPDGTAIDAWFRREPKAVKRSEARTFNILDYGAVRDSTLVQTAAIQRAIDAAARRGGTVVVPSGVFCSGALFFKPRTHLRLEEGATLKGSRDIADYPDSQVHIEGVLQPYVSALINAYGVNGFTISGKGTLDGAGAPWWDAFWKRREENPDCTNLEVRRPRMISINNSSDILIDGVHLRNAGFWNIHLYKCSRVRLRGVDVYAPVSPVKAPSTDGVDIDACFRVHIESCSFATGDDLIAVKGGKGPWADTDTDNGTNAEILIENCSFGHGVGVLVFGSECVGAKNVILRNSSVRGTSRLLWLKMRPDTPQDYSHILVEGVKGNADRLLYIRPWTQFFDLKGRADIPMSYASGVTIRGCDLKCRIQESVERDSTQYVLSGIRWQANKIRFTYNTAEAEVGPYVLEDPLVFADGRTVDTPDAWRERRSEILSLFEKEMYGRIPGPSPVYVDSLEGGPTLAGFGLRKQLRMWFREDRTGPKIDWMVLRPRNVKGPVPVVIMLNYYGNHTILRDPDVLVPDCWLDDSDTYCIRNNRASGQGRGLFENRNLTTVYPVDMILARGYALVTACYGDVCADPEATELQDSLAYGGVFQLWHDARTADGPRALGAWAWALMRGLDMIEGLPELDASRVLLTGSSRLGKAALLAGAYDERFAVVVLNQTGGGGVPLSKRNFGEHVRSETSRFTHWFSPSYAKYAGCEATAMPFDQHLLVSCIAPRPLMVQGFDNPWFDTRGEFLCIKAASPVWEFLGEPGLPDVEWPDDYDTSAVGASLAYVRRDQGHGIAAVDWTWMLDFADRALR
ncbi:MAG: hypothetical protein J6Y45_03765 [Bacteroidales bacterium]|nr:hypothetical protein [Bacteroidales bacterium]